MVLIGLIVRQLQQESLATCCQVAFSLMVHGSIWTWMWN